MKTLGDQAKEFREAKGWNTTQMGAAVGTSRQNIESLEAAGNRIPKYISALAGAMGTTVDHMLALAGLGALPAVMESRPVYEVARLDMEIPQFATGGAMGSGVILRDQPGMIHSWRVSPEWVQKNVHSFTALKNLAIVTGFGDSMRPLYNPGDPLLVDTGVKTVEFDAIYFFRVGDEGFIKRLQRIPGNGLLAISENQSYRDWTIQPDMDFEVFARVVKVWRGEDF